MAKVTISACGSSVTLDAIRRPAPEIVDAVKAMLARKSSQADFWASVLVSLDAAINSERMIAQEANDAAAIDKLLDDATNDANNS